MRSKPTRHPRVEALLQRVLLSVSVVKETLNIEGTAGKDVISLSVHPQVINLMSVKVNGDEKVFLLGSFKVININTLGGNDMVRVGELYDGHPAYLNIDLGAGNDRAYGSAHAETIIGGNGNDRISAGAGNDYVNAGSGNDIVVGDLGNDTLVGLHGKDSIFGGDGNDSISGGDDDDSLDGGNHSDTVNGGSGNDRLTEIEKTLPTGASYINLILGAGGDDYIHLGPFGSGTVYGGEGDDYLISESSDIVPTPYLHGDAGDDKLIGMVLSGGSGDDRMLCTSGRAVVGISGDEGNDFISVENAGAVGFISGNDGNDTIESAAQTSQINGNAGDDQITFAGNYASGDEGDDLVRSAAGILRNVTVSNGGKFVGGKGNDTLIGSPYGDVMEGGDDADEIRGEAGDDWLGGDAGNDVLYGGSGTDSIHGGDGNDFLYGGGYRDSNTSDDGRDIAYGEGGKDFFDTKHRWASTDADSADQNRPPIYVPSNSGISMSGSISYASNGGLIKSGTANLTIRDTTPSLGLMGRTAVFSGLKVANLQSTSDPDSVPLMPALTASERKSIRPSIIHVPADWNLIRLGKSGGLIWYRIQSLTMKLNGQPLPYGLASLAMRSHTTPDAASRPVDSMHVYSIAVHPATLFTNDSANSFPVSTSNWIASGFDAASAATRKPMTIAGSSEIVSFKQPGASFLTSTTFEAGKRYLLTATGLRLITAEGVGAIVS